MNTEMKFKEMKLSDQALGAMMMALQKSLLAQTDVTETLRGFSFVDTEDGLWVKNPPIVKFDWLKVDENGDEVQDA